MKPRLQNRRISPPVRWRGRGVLTAVEDGLPHEITFACMTAYMLVSMERVNKTWSVRLHAAAVHLQRFCYAEVHGYVDRCSVCHTDLKGYRDGRCFRCFNVAICRECVQCYDPKFTQGRDIFEFQDDSNSPECGDAVCLQCAVVSESGRLRQPLMSAMSTAADAIDALLGDGDFHPRRTLPRLFFTCGKRCYPVETLTLLRVARLQQSQRWKRTRRQASCRR